MNLCIKVSKEDLLMLQELEVVTGIEKHSIISILIDEAYSGYKCAEMSGNSDYMLMQLTTKELEKNIKSKSRR